MDFTGLQHIRLTILKNLSGRKGVPKGFLSIGGGLDYHWDAGKMIKKTFILLSCLQQKTQFYPQDMTCVA